MANLYLLTQTENDDWDTFDSCVVCAETENAARDIQPGGGDGKWGGEFSPWCSDPYKVTIRLIGTAALDVRQGVVIASYNAG